MSRLIVLRPLKRRYFGGPLMVGPSMAVPIGGLAGVGGKLMAQLEEQQQGDGVARKTSIALSILITLSIGFLLVVGFLVAY